MNSRRRGRLRPSRDIEPSMFTIIASRTASWRPCAKAIDLSWASSRACPRAPARGRGDCARASRRRQNFSVTSTAMAVGSSNGPTRARSCTARATSPTRAPPPACCRWASPPPPACPARTSRAGSEQFDFGRHLRVGEGLLQHVLRLRLPLIVVRGDGDVEARLHLRDHHVWAVGRLCDEPAAMERRARAHAVRNGRGGAERQRPAHAVALHAHLLRPVHLLLRVEPRDVRGRIVLGRARRADAAHHLPELRHVLGVLEAEALHLDPRRLGHAVVGVRHQHRVALRGQALAHVAHGGPQAEGVGPDDHRRMAAAGRVDERRVARAVGRLHLDVGFDHRRPARWRSRPQPRQVPPPPTSPRSRAA